MQLGSQARSLRPARAAGWKLEAGPPPRSPKGVGNGSPGELAPTWRGGQPVSLPPARGPQHAHLFCHNRGGWRAAHATLLVATFKFISSCPLSQCPSELRQEGKEKIAKKQGKETRGRIQGWGSTPFHPPPRDRIAHGRFLGCRRGVSGRKKRWTRAPLLSRFTQVPMPFHDSSVGNCLRLRDCWEVCWSDVPGESRVLAPAAHPAPPRPWAPSLTGCGSRSTQGAPGSRGASGPLALQGCQMPSHLDSQLLSHSAQLFP